MDKIRQYSDDDIDVFYNLKRCIHAEECIRGLPAVFDVSKRPWIQPDQARADAIASVIERCPSGALHYKRKDSGELEVAPDKNAIVLSEDGPLYAHGRLRMLDADGETVAAETRAALCRCGVSENKPYCDNSHKKIGFRAPGSFATKEEAIRLPEAHGELQIKVRRNASLLLTGDVEIHSQDGNTVFATQRVYICRCGGSQNKPFCDSSHKTNGFQG